MSIQNQELTPTLAGGKGEDSPEDLRFETQNRTQSKVAGLALRGHPLAARAHPPRTVHGADAGKINIARDYKARLTNAALNVSAR